MTFGEVVANRRRELGISQRTLADTLKVSSGYLCRVENGIQKPSKRFAQRLTDTLNLEGCPDTNYLTGNASVDLEVLEKRVTNAIYELEIILNIVRSMKGDIK